MRRDPLNVEGGEDNTKMDLKEMGCEGEDWIKFIQDRFQWWAVVVVLMNLRVTERVGNFLTS
jgi:hypothetical protein